MNAGLRTKAKNGFEKNIFNLISIFLSFDELVSEPNYDAAKWFSANILLIGMNKIVSIHLK